MRRSTTAMVTRCETLICVLHTAGHMRDRACACLSAAPWVAAQQLQEVGHSQVDALLTRSTAACKAARTRNSSVCVHVSQVDAQGCESSSDRFEQRACRPGEICNGLRGRQRHVAVSAVQANTHLSKLHGPRCCESCSTGGRALCCGSRAHSTAEGCSESGPKSRCCEHPASMCRRNSKQNWCWTLLYWWGDWASTRAGGACVQACACTPSKRPRETATNLQKHSSAPERYAGCSRRAALNGECAVTRMPGLRGAPACPRKLASVCTVLGRGTAFLTDATT